MGIVLGHANGDGIRHRQTNGHENGHNGIANGKANGSNGHVNGHGNSQAPGSAATLDRWHVESASGRKEGRSFHHGRLIMSLRRRCIEDAPNLDVMEATVRDLIYCDDSQHVIGVKAAFKLRSGVQTGTDKEDIETVEKNVYAPITIIADGYASKFRKTPGSRVPRTQTRSPICRCHIEGYRLARSTYGHGLSDAFWTGVAVSDWAGREGDEDVG